MKFVVVCSLGALAAGAVVAAMPRTLPVPDEYKRWRNPLPSSPSVLRAGAEVFEVNCAPCHNFNGDGRGPAAAELTPLPADLRDTELHKLFSDAYLYYRISEGKDHTAMPAFGPSLSEEDRAAVIRYVRTLPTQGLDAKVQAASRG
jgi:mono/diheme cytochrome c family protein